MHEIIFRCDASNKKNVGTGHIFRSLAIADFFCKNFNLDKKKILFVIKKNKHFSYVSKIIKNKNYLIKGFLGSEVRLLNKFKSKSLIIDRVKIENQKDINKLKSTFSKIVCLDSENKELKNCLRINSLIHNNNVKYSGYKYLITPLVNNIKSQVPIKKNKIFISLGGVKRKIKIFNILKILNKIEGLKVSIPEFITRNNNNNLKYDNNSFYKNLYDSNLVICSGGLILFDSLFLKKRIICIPNDKYQQKNIKNINKFMNYKVCYLNNLKYLQKNVINNLSLKNYKIKFKISDMKYTLNVIYKYING